MNEFLSDLEKTKKIYRDIFEKAAEAIDTQLNLLKKSSLCNHCDENCSINYNEINLFQEFPRNCMYKFWQEAALDRLNNQVSRDIYEKIQTIEALRKNYKCGRCSSCCCLASSEFTYDELKQKAKEGDKFAAEFISVFVPYKNNKDAEKIYPDYVKAIKEKFGIDCRFYYCPKLDENGLCSDYENRPSICRDFPNNPLVALPEKCSFKKWKDEVEVTALLLHSMIEIVGFYKEKLEKLLKK